MSSEAEFLAVLKAHPLIAGEGFYAGHVICDSCHVVPGDPAEHLARVLAEALDPSYARPEAAESVETPRFDPRESQIVWEASQEAS